jgi:hypothetical protein
MCAAMCSASSFTQPSSAKPRVCCHARPRKYRPAEAVTPRSCTSRPPSSKTGTSTHEWSIPKLAAHTTASTARDEPSANVTVASAASRVRGRSRMPCRRRAEHGLEPMSVSRSLTRRPIREVARLGHQSRRLEDPEEIASEDALRQRGLARPERPRVVAGYGSPHPAGGVIRESIRKVPRCRRWRCPGTLLDMSRFVRRYRQMLRRLQDAQTTAAFA